MLRVPSVVLLGIDPGLRFTGWGLVEAGRLRGAVGSEDEPGIYRAFSDAKSSSFYYC